MSRHLHCYCYDYISFFGADLVFLALSSSLPQRFFLVVYASLAMTSVSLSDWFFFCSRQTPNFFMCCTTTTYRCSVLLIRFLFCSCFCHSWIRYSFSPLTWVLLILIRYHQLFNVWSSLVLWSLFFRPFSVLLWFFEVLSVHYHPVHTGNLQLPIQFFWFFILHSVGTNAQSVTYDGIRIPPLIVSVDTCDRSKLIILDFDKGA